MHTEISPVEDSHSRPGIDLKRLRWWERLNTFLFEAPVYLSLVPSLISRGLGPRDLMKANWSLDHGGLGFASKYKIQKALSSSFAIDIEFVSATLSPSLREKRIQFWMARQGHSFPIILKPDNGRIGKGVFRVDSAEELLAATSRFKVDFVAQPFCDLPQEYGVFFFRRRGKAEIFSINGKSFPEVRGDGQRSVAELISEHPRLRLYQKEISHKIDFEYVPAFSERVQLSYVGNHAQGAVFFDASYLKSAELLSSLEETLRGQDGINYGRFDLKARDPEALMRGDFKVIELNGVDSLSTNVFDPDFKLGDAYRILYRQYKTLIEIAHEHSEREMFIESPLRLLRRVYGSEQALDRTHQLVMNYTER